MKTAFLLIITASLLFVQCKKSEALTEEFVQTQKANSTDILNNTQWEVISVISINDNVNISWAVKHPKFSFRNSNVEMKLGRDLCTKEYLCRDAKFVAAYATNCQITNQNHAILANLFSGDFSLSFSPINPDEMYIKSFDEKVFTLRRIVTLTNTSVQ